MCLNRFLSATFFLLYCYSIGLITDGANFLIFVFAAASRCVGCGCTHPHTVVRSLKLCGSQLRRSLFGEGVYTQRCWATTAVSKISKKKVLGKFAVLGSGPVLFSGIMSIIKNLFWKFQTQSVNDIL